MKREMEPNVRVVNEICTKVEIPEYESTISRLVTKAEVYSFQVCCQYITDQSVTEWGTSRLIRLGIKSGKAKGITVIWDLLHELGHLMDGEPESGKDMLREKSAWNHALELLNEFTDLKKEIVSFYSYRDQCLDSYRKFA